jgi:Protein of Unknown function (DUF2784)
MGYKLLTTLVLALHFSYLAYLVVGGFFAWRWPRTIWLHLVAAVWGLAVIGIPMECPLTYAEDWSRRRAGEAGLTQGFIDRYIEGVLYPERFTGLLQALVAVLVVGSYAGFFVLQRRRRARRPVEFGRPITAVDPAPPRESR